MAGNDEMFKVTLMGGYDKEDVLRQFQKMKEESYAEKSKLLQIVRGRDKKIEELNLKIEERDREIDRLETDIREKYQSYIDNYETIGRLVYDAKVRSEQMIKDAHEESEQIIREAQEEAVGILNGVQQQVDDKLADGKKKYIAIQEELNDIVELINQVQRRFMTAYRSVHDIVRTIPPYVDDPDDDLEDIGDMPGNDLEDEPGRTVEDTDAESFDDEDTSEDLDLLDAQIRELLNKEEQEEA